jgi:nitroreductase
MEILKAVKERRSIRDFQKKKIPSPPPRVSKKEAVEVIE